MLWECMLSDGLADDGSVGHQGADSIQTRFFSNIRGPCVPSPILVSALYSRGTCYIHPEETALQGGHLARV